MSDSRIIPCPNCLALNRVPLERLAERPACGKCRKPLFTGQPLELAAHEFYKHVRRSTIPVVVDFWAPWCGPCQMMAPAFAAAAQALEPRFRLARLNTEAVPQIGPRYGVRSIPTLILFRNGREIARQTGALDQGSIVRWITEQG